MPNTLDFDRYEFIDDIPEAPPLSSQQAGLGTRLLSKAIERPIEQTLGIPGTIQQIRATQAMKPSEIEVLNIPEPLKKQALEAAQYYEKSVQNAPTIENIRATIGKFLPEKALESETAFEKFADRVLSNAPFLGASILTGGTPLLYGLGREVGSALAGQTMEELGYGPLAQGLMEAGVRSGLDIIRNFRGAKIQPRMEKLRENNYSYTDKIAKNKIVDAPNHKETIDNLLSKASGANSGMEYRDAKRVVKELTAAQNDIGKFGTVDLGNAIDKKRHFNSLYAKTSNPYYGAAAKSINENVIAPFAQNNPDWAQKWYQAEGLTRLFNNVEKAEKFGTDLAKLVLPGGKLKKLLSIPKWIFSSGKPGVFTYGKIAPGEVMNEFGDILKYSLAGDKANLSNALINAHNIIEGKGASGMEPFDTDRYELIN